VLVKQSGFSVGADVISVTAPVCATIVKSNDQGKTCTIENGCLNLTK